MITRTEARDVLYDIINSGIISEEMEDKIQDIVNCLFDEEELGIHSWGMPDDERHEIYLAVRTDLPEYKDHVKKCKEIIEKYSFKR